MLGKVGKSNLGSELMNGDNEVEEDNNKDRSENEIKNRTSESDGMHGSSNIAAIDDTKYDKAEDKNSKEIAEDGVTKHDDEEDRIAGFGGSGSKLQRKKVVAEPSAASILDNFNF